MAVSCLLVLFLVFCFCRCYLVLRPETQAVVRQGQPLELTCQSNVSGGVYWFYSYDDAGKSVTYGTGGNDLKQCVNRTDQAFIECDFEEPWRFKLTLLHPSHNQIIYCSRTLNRKVSNCSTKIFVQVPVSNLTVMASQDAVSVGETNIIICQTNYCNPPANITWYKGNTEILGSPQVTTTFNTSSKGLVRMVSELRFTSVAGDNCQRIYCTASNIEGERVESKGFKNIVTTSQPNIILVECDVTTARILWSDPNNQSFPLQQVTLQLSTWGGEFVNASYEQLEANPSYLETYQVTKLQSNTEYRFRLVVFDGCVSIPSESVKCNTANDTDTTTGPSGNDKNKPAESSTTGPIITGSLAGSVSFIALAGGFVLFKCIRKYQQRKRADQKDCHYIDHADIPNDHQYQDIISTENAGLQDIDEFSNNILRKRGNDAASDKMNDRGEYLELPENGHANNSFSDNAVTSSDKTDDSGEYLELPDNGYINDSFSDNAFTTSTDIIERGEYLELPLQDFNNESNLGNTLRQSDNPCESGEYMELPDNVNQIM